VLRDAEAIASFGEALAAPFATAGVTHVVALEARGFAVGALCARSLSAGLVLARKPGAVHPGDVATVTSAPDWRGNRVELALATVLGPDHRALVVDDWIETGSQATAVREAIESMGAVLVGVSVLVDDTTAAVREALGVRALVSSDELPR
jgi:adenine phosphoribosyltransferase